MYEDFLNASEGLLDLLDVEEIVNTVQTDHDQIISRWDTLCSNIEKCLNRLARAKVLFTLCLFTFKMRTMVLI